MHNVLSNKKVQAVSSKEKSSLLFIRDARSTGKSIDSIYSNLAIPIVSG